MSHLPFGFQAECLLPASRDRRDIIGAAQTGSGKTLAFGLPIMQRLVTEADGEAGAGLGERKIPGSPLRALVLTPTRELAMQVGTRLRRAGRSSAHPALPVCEL